MMRRDDYSQTVAHLEIAIDYCQRGKPEQAAKELEMLLRFLDDQQHKRK